MSDAWATPPTANEIAAAKAGAWSTPPTPGERGAVAPAPDGPGKIESAGRGIVQGATLGFGDEIQAAAKALGVSAEHLVTAVVTPALAPSLIGIDALKQLHTRGLGGVAADYRAARDAERGRDEAAQSANPGSYLAGQLGGGLATALVPGAGEASIGKALATGAAIGGAAGLGGSSADLTAGDVAGAAKDTAAGAAIGAAGNAIGHGIGAAAGKLRGLLPSRRAVEHAAGKLGEVADVAQSGQSVREMMDRAGALEADASKQLGEPFQFSPGQASGVRSLLLKESAAAQSPATMDAAQKMQGKRLDQLGKVLDLFTGAVAKDPTRLGNAEVGGNVAKALDGYASELATQRSAVGGPMFERVDKLAGNMPIVPTSALRGAVAQLEDEAGVKAAPLIHKVLARADQDGAVRVGDVQRLLSYLSAGNAPVAAGLTEGQSYRAARILRQAINTDLDAASQESATVGPSIAKAGKAAVEALRQARATWADYSGQIDNVMSSTVKRVLGLAENDAPDAVVAKLSSAGTSPNQVAGVMTTLGKAGDAGKAAAQDLRAQVMSNMFADAGKRPADAAFQSSVASESLSAARLRSLLDTHGARIKALFADDPTSMAKLQMIHGMAERLALTPGLRGSQTTPLAEQILAMRAASRGGVAAALSTAMREAIDKRVLGEGAFARAVATPEGVQAWHDLMRAQMSGASGGAGEAAYRTTIKSLAQLTAIQTRDDAMRGTGGDTQTTAAAQEAPQ